MRKAMAFVLVVGMAGSAPGQSRFLVTDRTSTVRKVWLLEDRNHNDVIDEPSEVSVFFDGANTAGTPALTTPASLGVRGDGLVVVGDSGARTIYFLRDINGDSDAQDPGESLVIADSSTPATAVFNAPLGVAFDAGGTLHVCNAGSGSGVTANPDGLYRIIETDLNHLSQPASSITRYVGEDAGTNGPYSPGEFWFGRNNVGFLHDSSATKHGVWRFADTDASGRADDPGEFTAYFTTGNGSGLTISAGFALEPDKFRSGALYMLQTVSSTNKQLIRMSDTDSSGDANGSGEAQIVNTTTESTIAPNDLVCLDNGDVLFTDVTGKKVYRLHDGNGNDVFEASERFVFLANPTSALADVRHIAILPPNTACTGDVNVDGVVNGSDVLPFVGVLLDPDAAPTREYYAADVNCNRTVDGDDIPAFVVRLP